MPTARLFLSALVFLSSCALAGPAMDIVNSCHDGKPASSDIKLKELDGGGFVIKPFLGCESQYQINFDDKVYGYVSCNEKQYLIVNGARFLAAEARNYSINKGIMPGEDMFAGSTIFYGLIKDGESYVCITAPLFDSGRLANYMVFYLIKHRPMDKNPEVGFYFMDKIEW